MKNKQKTKTTNKSTITKHKKNKNKDQTTTKKLPIKNSKITKKKHTMKQSKIELEPKRKCLVIHSTNPRPKKKKRISAIDSLKFGNP